MDNPPTTSDPLKMLNPDLKPQKSTNIEAGIKGNLVYRGTKFFNNIYFEATFFNSIIEDEIVPFDVFGDVFYRNSAKTNRMGVEIGAGLEIFRGLNLNAAYTFSDFKYDEYLATTIEDSSGTIITRTRDFSDFIVPSVPKHNLAIDLSYHYPISKDITAFIKGHYWYVTDMWVDDGNTELNPSYQLINATAGVDWKINKFNLLFSFGVLNMFDELYSAFININSAKKEFYEAGEPRNYFASLKFGYTFN
jgi:iron complex outermembrane receptor protein